MPDVSFVNLLVVVAVAVAAPLVVGYLPRLRVPAVVLEIVGGIVIGPSVLGWVRVDLPVAILALFGLAFLLFLAGLEIDVHRLRGRLLRFAVFGYLVTLVLGLWRRGVLYRGRLGVAAVAAGDRAVRHLARPGGAGAQGRGPGPQPGGADRAGGGERCRLRRHRLAVAVLLLLGREHGLEGGGARRVRRPRGGDRPRRDRCRPVHAARPGACPAAGHHCRDQGPLRRAAAGGVHRPGRKVRPGEHPWRLPGRRDRRLGRPRLLLPPALPRQAGGDRLRIPGAGVLRQQRHQAGPDRTAA